MPVGKDENDNIEVDKPLGTRVSLIFEIRDHVTLGEMHSGLDFCRRGAADRLRFVVMKGRVRAYIAHCRSSCWICIRNSTAIAKTTCRIWLTTTLYGTGQLPKFAGDLFFIPVRWKKKRTQQQLCFDPDGGGFTLTNLVRDEIIDERSAAN